IRFLECEPAQESDVATVNPLDSVQELLHKLFDAALKVSPADDREVEVLGIELIPVSWAVLVKASLIPAIPSLGGRIGDGRRLGDDLTGREGFGSDQRSERPIQRGAKGDRLAL